MGNSLICWFEEILSGLYTQFNTCAFCPPLLISPIQSSGWVIDFQFSVFLKHSFKKQEQHQTLSRQLNIFLKCPLLLICPYRWAALSALGARTALPSLHPAFSVILLCKLSPASLKFWRSSDTAAAQPWICWISLVRYSCEKPHSDLCRRLGSFSPPRHTAAGRERARAAVWQGKASQSQGDSKAQHREEQSGSGDHAQRWAGLVIAGSPRAMRQPQVKPGVNSLQHKVGGQAQLNPVYLFPPADCPSSTLANNWPYLYCHYVHCTQVSLLAKARRSYVYYFLSLGGLLSLRCLRILV